MKQSLHRRKKSKKRSEIREPRPKVVALPYNEQYYQPELRPLQTSNLSNTKGLHLKNNSHNGAALMHTPEQTSILPKRLESLGSDKPEQSPDAGCQFYHSNQQKHSTVTQPDQHFFLPGRGQGQNQDSTQKIKLKRNTLQQLDASVVYPELRKPQSVQQSRRRPGAFTLNTLDRSNQNDSGFPLTTGSFPDSNNKKFMLHQKTGADGRLKFVPKTLKNFYCTQGQFKRTNLSNIPIDLFAGQNAIDSSKTGVQKSKFIFPNNADSIFENNDRPQTQSNANYRANQKRFIADMYGESTQSQQRKSMNKRHSDQHDLSINIETNRTQQADPELHTEPRNVNHEVNQMLEANRQMQKSIQEKDDLITESLQEQSKLKEALQLIKQTLHVVETTERKRASPTNQQTETAPFSHELSIMTENIAQAKSELETERQKRLELDAAAQETERRVQQFDQQLREANLQNEHLKQQLEQATQQRDKEAQKAEELDKEMKAQQKEQIEMLRKKVEEMEQKLSKAQEQSIQKQESKTSVLLQEHDKLDERTRLIESTLGNLIQKKETQLAESKQYLDRLPIEPPKTPTKESKDEKQQADTKVSDERIQLLEKENQDLRRELEQAKAEAEQAIQEKEAIQKDLQTCKERLSEINRAIVERVEQLQAKTPSPECNSEGQIQTPERKAEKLLITQSSQEDIGVRTQKVRSLNNSPREESQENAAIQEKVDTYLQDENKSLANPSNFEEGQLSAEERLKAISGIIDAFNEKKRTNSEITKPQQAEM